MGIRFHCPNGHKLNLKAFLAGKKGKCPKCNVKILIPERSEPGLDSDIEEPQQEAAKPAVAVAKPPTIAGTAPTVVPPGAARQSGIATPVMPVGGYPAMTAPPPITTTMPAGPPYAAPVVAMPVGRAPSPPMPPPPPPGSVDPIAENPAATWFVRPPSGGQFGPARGEVMRKWLTEGRVTADSLVWREGWIDWLSATEVFPQLGKSAPNMFGTPSTVVKPATSSVIARKPASGNMGAVILVILAIVCVLLVGVLAVVLSGALGSA